MAAPAHEVVTLGPGVAAVRSLETGETWHPAGGPAAEAEALYVRPLRLRRRAAATAGRPFVVWDVGLGAAGNALGVVRALADLPAALTLVSFDRTLAGLRFARRHAAVLGYLAGAEAAADALLARGRAAWRAGALAVTWTAVVGDFPGWLAAPADGTPAPDAILFDPHSPARNPEMWTLPLFTALRSRLDAARPCALATYSRSTRVRAALLLAGFHVGVGAAIAGREETTVAATVPELADPRLDARWLARAARSHAAEPARTPGEPPAPLAQATLVRLRRLLQPEAEGEA